MAKTSSTTSRINDNNNLILIIAALFVTAIPLISGQLAAPASAPMFPGGGGGGSPTSFDPMGAPSPAAGPDCTTYLLNLTDCLTFVSTGSNLTIPEPGCCSALSNLVDTQPICLCELIGNPGQTGLPIDTTKALQLPSVCNVTTPPVSLCAVAGVPVSLPPGQSQAPLASAPASDSGSGSGSGSVAASPSPGSGINQDNGANHQFTLTLSIGLAAATLFIYSHF